MEEIIKTLPQHSNSWLKGKSTLYKYQGFWHADRLIEGVIRAQRSFKAQPNEILLCSYPKTGTTWLKALAFAIVTRKMFDQSTSPLLTTVPHECIPFLENAFEGIDGMVKNPDFPLMSTHLPYTSLPESIIASNCKIVYVYRDAKDVLVSYYEFACKVQNIPVEDAPFAEAFDEFCQGLSWCGPYWDHILGYWKASLERHGTILFLKYEDMKNSTSSNVKKLAEFIGFPISIEEEQAGMVENIIKLCSFEHLSSLEVNQTGKFRAKKAAGAENQLFFRKAKVGDWENYFTEEMKDKMDKLMHQKLSGTGLVL